MLLNSSHYFGIGPRLPLNPEYNVPAEVPKHLLTGQYFPVMREQLKA